MLVSIAGRVGISGPMERVFDCSARKAFQHKAFQHKIFRARFSIHCQTHAVRWRRVAFHACNPNILPTRWTLSIFVLQSLGGIRAVPIARIGTMGLRELWERVDAGEMLVIFLTTLPP